MRFIPSDQHKRTRRKRTALHFLWASSCNLLHPIGKVKTEFCLFWCEFRAQISADRLLRCAREARGFCAPVRNFIPCDFMPNRTVLNRNSATGGPRVLSTLLLFAHLVVSTQRHHPHILPLLLLLILTRFFMKNMRENELDEDPFILTICERFK